MDTSGPLTPKMFADVIYHLFQEGERAYQQRQDVPASIWFAQCLYTLRSIGNQAEWMSPVLFHLGRLMVHFDRPAEAVGFLEASANVQMSLPQQGEDEADVAQTVGSFLKLIGYPVQAQYFLERARRTYQAAGVPAKAKAAEQEVQQLASQNRGGLPTIAPFQHFEIRIGTQVAGRLMVSAEGKIEWGEGDTLDHPPMLGVSIPWNVVCTTG